jgi:catechol 2,3-dioxygenase-like lactoylglutathione lyase family enzyme
LTITLVSCYTISQVGPKQPRRETLLEEGKKGKMQVQGVTVSVSDLLRSKAFYEGVLGFVPDAYYEPTRWQPYKFDGRAYFAIIEVPGLRREAWADVVNFDVDEIEVLWDRVRDKVEVETALSESPWGTYRFVIKDPDGYRLGFAGKK